jgi:heat shock protein HtpX
MRRIFYFLVTNLAILIVLSAVMKVFGIRDMSLLVFAAIFGMGGAFLSLALSKWSAKRLTGAKVIESPSNEAEAWLVRTVGDLAKKAGIGMPEVAVYPADDVNAFATGMQRNKALVAVSVGLMRKMDRDQVRAVLAHEVGHVANGDMTTLALIQGVLNTFVIYLSRVIGSTVDRMVFRTGEDDRHVGYGPAYWIITILAEIVLGILASIIVFWFSRKREYRADSSAASMVGKKPMMSALEALKASVRLPHLPDEMAAFGISGGKKKGLAALFATHPDLDDRISALAASRYPEYKP